MVAVGPSFSLAGPTKGCACGSQSSHVLCIVVFIPHAASHVGGQLPKFWLYLGSLGQCQTGTSIPKLPRSGRTDFPCCQVTWWRLGKVEAVSAILSCIGAEEVSIASDMDSPSPVSQLSQERNNFQERVRKAVQMPAFYVASQKGQKWKHPLPKTEARKTQRTVMITLRKNSTLEQGIRQASFSLHQLPFDSLLSLS